MFCAGNGEWEITILLSFQHIFESDDIENNDFFLTNENKIWMF